MELIFNNYQPGLWISEFEVTQDFNLHIERVDSGYLYIKQRSTPKGLFDNIKGASFDHADPVVDVDFVGTIYPKYIQIVSKVEPTYAEVTSYGDVTEISANKVTLEFVDLGLPSGLLWATCNLGATKPEDSGLCFAWGETQGYTAEDAKNGVRVFNWDNYMWNGNNSINSMTKYNAEDKLTTLASEDDAATAVDKSCRTPTYDELLELINNTDLQFVSDYNNTNISGTLCKSKINSNSIFLPSCGYCNDGTYFGPDGITLWSSTFDGGACCLYIKGSASGIPAEPYRGFTIRPVRPASN